jgi:hypothetical protein
MKKVSSMNSPPPILLNKMEWWNTRTRPCSLLQEPCWMTMEHPKRFGRKQSTQLVMHQIESTSIDSLIRRYMSSSLGRSLTSPTSVSLDANASSTRRKGSVNLKVDVIKGSFLVMHQTPKHIEYSTKPLS